MERVEKHDAALGRHNGYVYTCVYLHIHTSPLKMEIQMRGRNNGKWSWKNFTDLRVPTNWKGCSL